MDLEKLFEQVFKMGARFEFWSLWAFFKFSYENFLSYVINVLSFLGVEIMSTYKFYEN